MKNAKDSSVGRAPRAAMAAPVIPVDMLGRRDFLRMTLATAGAVSLGSFLSACSSDGTPVLRPVVNTSSPFTGMSALQAADANGVMLPVGFSSRVVAESGFPPVVGAQPWHGAPDGGACFPADDGGWVYVSNAELAFTPAMTLAGGAGALRFNKRGDLIDSYPVLRNTGGNCGGGATPWGTWLSGEEFEFAPTDPLVAAAGRSAGLMWECDPFSPWVDGQVGSSFPALGLFSHEAVCVDPVNRVLYLTEDASGGRFYRFVCDATDWPAHAARPHLQSGKLQVLEITALPVDAEVVAAATAALLDLERPNAVRWVDVLRPAEGQGYVRATSRAARITPPGTNFPKCEGAWFFNGIVYFATQSNHRIWAYDTANQTVEVIYNGKDNATNPAQYPVNRPDNITITALGEIIASEDGGNLEIGVVRPDGTGQVIARLIGHNSSETTGPALSPDGTRLYFSSQRGTRGVSEGGMTFEIKLPRPAK